MKMYFIQDDDWGKRAPEPRKSGGGMHPGWACFMLAWWSGIFTALAMFTGVEWARTAAPLGLLILNAAIAAALLVLAARRAENLWERKP